MDKKPSRLQSIRSQKVGHVDDTNIIAESKEELKVKEESEKAGLKLNIKKKTKIMVSGPITS